MAHHELMVTLPSVELIGGYQIVLEAIDPTTGNIVPGAVVSLIAIYANGPGTPQTTIPPPPFGGPFFPHYLYETLTTTPP